ncbi:hypothetical protein ACP70R_010686 [Stipagrostis hirtigluma subsp. patula]
MAKTRHEKVSKNEGSVRNLRKKRNAFPLHRLPPDILSTILSQLPFKEAVRTSIVSRNWRRLWRYCPKLILTREMMLGSSATGDHPTSVAATFIGRVNSIMGQLSSVSATLNKFVVKFPLLQSDSDHIDQWVSLSAVSRARRIILDLCPKFSTERNERYRFPLHLFSGSCVKSLCLGYVSLKLPPGLSGFTNLKKVGLHMVSITGDLEYLLPECDVLEWLSLTECSLHPYLIIGRPLQRLRYLRVLHCRLQKLELQAPNLTEFEFTNYQVSFVLGDCPNMSMASIVLLSPLCAFGYACTELPNALPHVKDCLSISLKIRTETREFVKGNSVFANLRHLILKVDIEGCPQTGTGVLQLACLLELAPVLEELELHMYYRETPIYKCNLDETTSPSLHKRLRAVHMTGFYGIRGQIELARHILRSTVALERLIVDPKVRVPRGLSPRHFTDFHYADSGRNVARRFLQTREFPGTVITIL